MGRAVDEDPFARTGEGVEGDLVGDRSAAGEEEGVVGPERLRGQVLGQIEAGAGLEVGVEHPSRVGHLRVEECLTEQLPVLLADRAGAARLRPCPQGSAWKDTIGSPNGRVRRNRSTSSANGVWMSPPPGTWPASSRFGLVRGAISFSTAFPLGAAPVVAARCLRWSVESAPIPKPAPGTWLGYRDAWCRKPWPNDRCDRGAGELRRLRDALSPPPAEV